MNFRNEFAALLGAHVPLIHLVTYEEERVLRTLAELEAARSLGLVVWDLADGFAVLREGKDKFPAKDCTSDNLLPHLAEKLPPGYLVVLRDFHHSWLPKRGPITRKLRNMIRKLRAQSQFLVVITPPLPREHDLPLELKDDAVVLQVPLPDSNELNRLFDEVTAKVERSKLPRPEVRDKLIQSALGLTTNQARLAFSRVWATYQRFDEQGIALVTVAKQQVIRESGALEFWPADQGEADVGGLDQMKSWLKKREVGFGPEARAANIPYPRGVALIGIPGTGKSLSAKMLAGLWKLPLLRLDIGALFGSLLGESEQNLRKAFMLAETVSPCILWVDEIEKALAGSGASSLNAGAATRVFGTFLTWMQEHRSPVFVIATANDIEGLPPELLRKGRFDEIFFIDLPTPQERANILAIHLSKHHRDYREFDLATHALATEGFSGAEMEQVIVSALYMAFGEGEETRLADRHLAQAIAQTVPLSKSMAPRIDALRREATEKWRSASGASPEGSTVPDASFAETMPQPKKPKRVFDI